jgi:hypothetical protein
LSVGRRRPIVQAALRRTRLAWLASREVLAQL